VGNTDIKDALQNLDRLTQEEARIANAELLNIAHGVRCKVNRVSESIQVISEDLQGVNDTLQNTVQDLDNRAEQVNRELSFNTISLPSEPLQILTGKQLRERLQTWISAADPSINHNILCDSQLEGTAQWFIRGIVFNQWKNTSPFLWVHGKRALLLSCFSATSLIVSIPQRALERAYSGSSLFLFLPLF